MSPQHTQAHTARRLRVGVVLPGISANESDACIPVQRDLARRLSSVVDLRILALRYPLRRDRYRLFDAEVIPLAAGRATLVRRLLLLREATRVLGAEHRRQPFDLLHAMWADEPGWLVTQVGRQIRVPSVVSIVGGELTNLADIRYGAFRSRVSRYLVSRALARADRVLVGSRYVEQQVVSKLGEEGARRVTETLPLGVDLDVYRPDGPQRDLLGEEKILHVASLLPVKDAATLLRAFALLLVTRPAARLHFVGDGPLRSELTSLAAKLGIADRITFHGNVRNEEMPSFYRAADLCVLSSRHEGHGMVVLEAAACGRITVGTAVGVLPDLMPSGWIAPVGDAGALAATMQVMLADPKARREAEIALRRRVVSEYSLAQNVERLVELYRRLVIASAD